MSIVVSCYNGHKLTANDEHLGTRAKCPICGVIVPVPRPSKLTHQPEATEETTAPPPLVIPTGEPLAEDPSRLTQYAGMAKVRQGLGYHYARVVVYLLTIFVLCVSVVFGTFGKFIPALDALWGIGLALTVILLYFQPLLGLVGSILCLTVPHESGGKGYIIASVVLDLTAIPIGTALQMADIPLLWAAPLGFIAWVLFMLFLRRLARFLHRTVEEGGSRELLTDGFLLLVPPLLVVLLIYVQQLTEVRPLYFVISVALFFAWLVQGIKFLFALVDLIGGLRDGIRARLPEA
jgi:hypothetical protein